jgi:hypothetical protein
VEAKNVGKKKSFSWVWLPLSFLQDDKEMGDSLFKLIEIAIMLVQMNMSLSSTMFTLS